LKLAKINIEKEIKNIRIIDSHMHFGIAPNHLYYNYSDERVVELQKKSGVKVGICQHGISYYDLDTQIEKVLEANAKFGKSIYYNLFYDPKKSERSLEIIEKNKDKINFSGVKVWSSGFALGLDDKLFYPLWEYAVQNDIVISAHTWSPYTDNPIQAYSNPLLLESVYRDYPNVKIILVHSGGKVDFYDEVIEFARKHETAYLDFSGDCFYPPIFKKVLNKIGNGRSLFGTDMPMMDVRYHIANVLAADISDSDKEDIFYNNAAKFLKLSEEQISKHHEQVKPQTKDKKQ
jgi:predicted TIM-barrel fold metal-dependent hydrolase